MKPAARHNHEPAATARLDAPDAAAGLQGVKASTTWLTKPGPSAAASSATYALGDVVSLTSHSAQSCRSYGTDKLALLSAL